MWSALLLCRTFPFWSSHVYTMKVCGQPSPWVSGWSPRDKAKSLPLTLQRDQCLLHQGGTSAQALLLYLVATVRYWQGITEVRWYFGPLWSLRDW